MKIVLPNRTIVPLTAGFTKSFERSANRLNFIANPQVFYDLNINDTVLVYDDAGTLIYNGFVVKRTLSYSNGMANTQIIAHDKESLLFNRIWSESFSSTESPLILGSIAAKITNDFEGINLTQLNIKYVGYPRTDGIQVTKTEHPEIEFTHDDVINNTAAYQAYVSLPDTEKFKKIDYGGFMKPVFDWFKDLSQPNNTGVQQNFVFFIDENLNLKWYSTSSISNPTTVQLFDNFTITDSQETKVNFIIAYLGKDLNGAPIYTYAYKDYSGAPNIQETIKDWADIARDLKDQYSDNSAFRERVKEIGKDRARSYFETMTLGMIEGNLTEVDYVYRLGDVLNIVMPDKKTSYRVKIKKMTYSWDMQTGEKFKYDFEQDIA